MALPVTITVGAPWLKWEVTMLDTRVSVLNDSPIRCSVRADSGGLIVNPLSYLAEFAFSTTDTDPGSWVAGTWDVTATGMYVMQIRSGATGAALAVGTYYLWTRITGGGDVDIKQPGRVIVE